MKQKVRQELVQQRMRRMISRNRGYRRDMATAGRFGIFYFAEMLIEAKLLLDHLDGKKSNAKALVMEVAPDWVGSTTAHRIIQRMKKDGFVTIETDPADRRSLVIRPTQKLLVRCEQRWMRIVDEKDTPRPVDQAFLPPQAVAERWRLHVQSLANWRAAAMGPEFVRIDGQILYPLARVHEYENRDPRTSLRQAGAEAQR
jgi:hypothetical protein